MLEIKYKNFNSFPVTIRCFDYRSSFEKVVLPNDVTIFLIAPNSVCYVYEATEGYLNVGEEQYSCLELSNVT